MGNLVVSSSAGWCKAEISEQNYAPKAGKTAKGLSQYNLNLTMTENTGGGDRTASITIRDKKSSAKAVFKLTQKRQGAPYVKVSSSTMDFPAAETTLYNSLETNVDLSRIEVTYSSNWATCALIWNADPSTGKAVLKCHVDANTSASGRIAKITINVKDCPEASASFTIKQAAPYVSVSSLSMSLSMLDDTQYNTIETNVDASQIEVTTPGGWASCEIEGDVDQSTRKAKLKCHVDANYSLTGRTGTVTVKVKSCPNAKATFTISQKGALDTYEMVLVEGGSFMMGATSEQEGDAYPAEKPVHSVTLSSFYICKYEVTQAFWKAVMGVDNNPSWYEFIGDDLPVGFVSWIDCQAFITKLNQLTGKAFRFPTEAEWEYAARGGNKSKGYKYAGSNNISDVAWYRGNSGDSCHPYSVGSRDPNELGIYDMSGNMGEWCQDWYDKYSSSSQTNPTGPSTGSERVYRGGTCYDHAEFCRVSRRGKRTPSDTNEVMGFRIALSK